MKKYSALIHADGLELPVEISLERRRDTRFGVTGKRITLRMPVGVQPDFIHLQLKELQRWVGRVFMEKPALRAAFAGKNYATGDVLLVGKRQYRLEVQVQERATHTARLIGDTISIQLAAKATDAQRNRSIKTLLSRVVAGDFQAEIKRRVYDWNDRTFRRPIKSINLKYNSSNWGSCSAHNNVNLSTRLLFAPEEVQDYVILHELAHLVELNHSDRFWALVEQYMPDYQEKEKWLKVNRSKCDF
ncbi:MAG: SprT family zinc-dependent metalloprotease [Saprospiraceae bacterium]